MSNTAANVFGRDLACLPNSDGILDLTSDMQEATGNDVLIQSIVRRHLTIKGSDIASPNDGIDVRVYIKAGLTQTDISGIAAAVQQELVRDQRILPSTTVTASYNTETLVLTLNEVIQTASGPFSLTLAISQVTVDVIVGSQ
jgi:hypothetical protein